MVLFDLENLKIYHISLLFFNLQFLGSLEKCPGAQIKKKLDFKQEKALSSYSLSVVISVWTASPARKLCVILEAEMGWQAQETLLMRMTTRSIPASFHTIHLILQ